MDGNTAEREKRLTFQEMARELDKYRRILDTASDGFVTINSAHEVVYMNAAAERIFGYPKAEVLGRDLNILMPFEHHAIHRGHIESFGLDGPPYGQGMRMEVDAVRRDGEVFPAAIQLSAAKSEQGLLFTARIRDLSTERSLADQVQKSQRLALLGEMVAMVSHEIRTPLVLIGGFTARVLKDPGLSDGSRHKLSVVIDEVARLEGILNELGDLSRPKKYRWQEVILAEVIERVVELMRPTMETRHIKLKVDAPGWLPPITADPDRLNQVFINLLTNAAQACEVGAEISVSCRDGGDAHVLCEVVDQGRGMSAEVQEHVLDPFYTTKERGSGLGLPVALRIVEEHGGRLELESHVGKGTVARVYLPLSKNQKLPWPEPDA